MTGQVKFFKRDHGFGFIRTADGEVFFHVSDVRCGVEQLRAGAPVEFELAEGKQGVRAVQLVAIGEPSE